MRRSGIVLIAWGSWLGVMTGVQAAFRSIHGPLGIHWIEAAMLAGAATACVLCGLTLWALDARAGQQERPRALAADSVATATLVAGVALVLLGAGFGLWLILIGAGVAALGLGGLVRETLARRRRDSGQGAA
ncbi:MAG TPA: hypothetical protein VHW67_05365 [Solirubrobacteraceae bacterium]|jgi:hypothetical protein|nr:hypothetical protein [Solirubrobacteraceae bacterium]